MDNEKRKRKRYKLYTYVGSTANIPPRTKRGWRQKKKYMRDTVIKDGQSQTNSSGLHKESSAQSSEGNMGAPSTSSLRILSEHGIYDDPQSFNNIMECVNGQSENSDEDDDEANSTHDIDIEEATLSPSLAQYPTDVLIKTLLTMAIKIHHNLTYEEAEDMSWYARVLGNLESSHNSKYHWKKILNILSDFMSIHYFCDKCHGYMGKEVKNGMNGNRSLTCIPCNRVIDPNRNWESGYVMLYMNIKDQLQNFLALHHNKLVSLQTRRKENRHAIEDIHDGEIYKKLVSENMISLNFNIDGTPIAESSPVSVVPLLCIVNELNSRERAKHIMLNSLWFGRGKPKSMNEFLKPFVTEVKDLYTSGFEYEYEGQKYFKKCQPLVCVCDSIARPVVRNSAQFNGEYGCGLCLHPGLQVPKGNGSVRVYPIDEVGNPFGEGLRKHDETLRHAVEKEKGIKGRSTLCDIPNFNIIDNLVVNWMHSTTLGVAKQFGKLWFDSSYHDQEFYLGRQESLVNARLESFSLTLDISRTPRKISERSFWKAHEWAIWLLFYSLAVIGDLLPQKYVQHWALLVDGISILLKKSVMRSEIEYARNCLYGFVKDIPILYGIEHVLFNDHLLTHLPDSVLKWGPLWTHSAFIYENFNQILKNTIHSSNAVPLQVCDTLRYKCALNTLQSMCGDSMTYSQKQYLSKMLGTTVPPRPSLIVDDVAILGKVEMTTTTTLSRAYYLALRRLNDSIDNSQNIQKAKRIMLRKEMIHSKLYLRTVKRKSYIVLVNNYEIFEIEQFVIIDVNNSPTCYAIGRYYEKTRSLLFKNRKLSHMTFVKGVIDDLAAINVKDIKKKVTLIYMPKSKLFIACTHPNKFELLN